MDSEAAKEFHVKLCTIQNIVWSWKDVKRNIDDIIEEYILTTIEKCCKSAKNNRNQFNVITKNNEYEASKAAHMS